MAHECPECGQTCHCGGDIDDCLFTGTEEETHCSHWKRCEPSLLEGDDDLDIADPAEPGVDADPGL
jgi:hypothetical protein